MNFRSDADLVRAFLEDTSELSQSEIERAVTGVNQNDVSRWRRGDWKRLTSTKREVLVAYLQSRNGGTGEETPEEAIALDLPDVSFLQPEALAFYHQTLGEWMSNGWKSETLAAAARALTAFHRGESTHASEGPGQPDLSEEEQLLALRATRRAVESAFGPHARD